MEIQKVDQTSNKLSGWNDSRKIVYGHKEVKIYERKSFLGCLGKVATVLATVVAIAGTAGGLVWGIVQFGAQQTANVRLQATQVAANAQLQATQQAASAAQALDQERQTTFETYLDRMSDLLLIDHLQTSQSGSPVRAIAEARTFVTLRDMDPFRRAQLVRFLWKAGLVTGNQPVISLNAAPLNPSFFQHALLNGINLDGALLINGTIDDCNLQGATFKGAALPGATLNNVDLTGANLTGANLYGATLSDATLTGANLSRASLQYANLTGVDLRQVNLTAANLEGADLEGALITSAQLNQIATLQWAIMPDGWMFPYP
jgi:uncharacterized protein YjbI with pentapeptide repeats